MFRRAEWGSSQGSNLARRALAVCAVTGLTLVAQSIPAGADTVVVGSTAQASASFLAGGGQSVAGSSATWSTDPGPNQSGQFTAFPYAGLVRGDVDLLASRSTTTSALDASAISGVLGSTGAITFTSPDGGVQPITIDLLGAMRQSGADLTGALVDQAELRLGVGGSEITARGGRMLDPDGVGGPGRYKVGQADLDLHSPAIDDAAAQLYDAVGTFDTLTESTINKALSLTSLTSKLPAGATLTARVHSRMQDTIFKRLLAKPITTKNHVLTIDFSKGKATLHLDQAMHGQQVVDGPLLPGETVRPGDPNGLNNQNPNTEIIDDEIYPMIAETIHDLINEVVTIAVGEVQAALSSVTVDFITQLKSPLGTATSAWNVNLGGTTARPATCLPTGTAGPALCKTLNGLVNTVLVPLANKAVYPLRDLLIGDAGANLYGLAISDLKTGALTIPLRKALDPFLAAVTKYVSIQVNSQRTTTCVSRTGVRRVSGIDLSAFNVAVNRAAGGPSIGLGNSAVSTKCVGTIVR
ncbi:choice-of-anchor G family protein [Nocardioides jejuensis]|uniref:Choice-of-anchor G family protein n=1 Tax=Nocardioides jejuensis TaxID=2502782 RepID=A0A4R1CJM8_9ACTN|nr:choice-of-anchor G family protein [Nocardioides jejuensis]TCJ30386.1 choice-of-anchor G family protein [Nocardioides jejuensis]